MKQIKFKCSEFSDHSMIHRQDPKVEKKQGQNFLHSVKKTTRCSYSSTMQFFSNSFILVTLISQGPYSPPLLFDMPFSNTAICFRDELNDKIEEKNI